MYSDMDSYFIVCSILSNIRQGEHVIVIKCVPTELKIQPQKYFQWWRRPVTSGELATCTCRTLRLGLLA